MLHRVEDKRRLSKLIQEHLKTSSEVRPFPAVVTRLVAACQDPNADGRMFESIIECDPALSLKILRLANSPMFCPSGRVKSVAHAAALLGLRKLKSLAMSVAGASMFACGHGAVKQRQQLWTHCVGCAVVGRRMSEYIPDVSADDVFLAGIFHDVGKLLFYDVIPEEYSDIESSFGGISLIEEESFLLGTTHEEIGLASAVSWELPDEVKAAIGWHHRPEKASFCSGVTQAIHVADGLARAWGIGSEPHSERTIEFKNDYGFSNEQLDAIEADSRRAFSDTMTASD